MPQFVDLERKNSVNGGSYTFVVPGASKLEGDVYSPIFYVHNMEWQIGLNFGTMRHTKKNPPFPAMYFYLKYCPSIKSRAMSCLVTVELTLLSVRPDVKNITERFQTLYNWERCSYGYENFRKLDYILNEKNGYIKNDTITVEARIGENYDHFQYSREWLFNAVNEMLPEPEDSKTSIVVSFEYMEDVKMCYKRTPENIQEIIQKWIAESDEYEATIKRITAEIAELMTSYNKYSSEEIQKKRTTGTRICCFIRLQKHLNIVDMTHKAEFPLRAKLWLCQAKNTKVIASEKQLAELTAQNEQLQNKLQLTKFTQLGFKVKIHALSAELRDAQVKTDLENRIANLKEQLEIKAKETIAQRRSNSEMEKKLKDLVLQLEEERRQADPYKEQVEEANTLVKDLKSQLEKAQEEINREKAQKQKLQQEYEGILESHESMTQEISNLKKKLGESAGVVRSPSSSEDDWTDVEDDISN